MANEMAAIHAQRIEKTGKRRGVVARIRLGRLQLQQLFLLTHFLDL